MAVCVAMTYVGAGGLDDCPAEPMVPKYLMGESKLSGVSTRFTIEGFPTIPKLCSGGDTVHRADRLCRGGVGRLLRVHEGGGQRHPPQVA